MVKNVSDPRSNLEKAIQTGIDAALIDVYTCMPGQVISFDSVEQTADIQLTIKSSQGGKVVNRSVLKDVPVRFQKVFGFVITLPLKAGDEVEVKFSQRSLDTWLANSGIQDPADIRRHSSSDGYATPMLYSQPKKIVNFDAVNLQIRTEDGTKGLTLTPVGDMWLNGSADFAVAFNDLKAKLDALEGQLNGHVHPVGAGSTGVSATNFDADISASKVTTVRLP